MLVLDTRTSRVPVLRRLGEVTCQENPPAASSEPERERRRGKWLGRDGRVMGSQFGGLVHVPADPRVDAQTHVCFNCRGPGHGCAECPQPRTSLLCFNCSRLGMTIRSCPRCGEAHRAFLASQKSPSAPLEVATLTSATEATKKKRRRPRPKKKKSEEQATAGEAVERETAPTRLEESVAGSSKGSLYEQFCHTLRHLPPKEQRQLQQQ